MIVLYTILYLILYKFATLLGYIKLVFDDMNKHKKDIKSIRL